jgi:hypothetical protein
MSILVFSAERSELSQRENALRTEEVVDVLQERGASFREVEGVFNRVKEASFIVNAQHEGLVRELCQAFGQDCYLHVDNDKSAILRYPDGSDAYIGMWTQTPHEPSGDYTYDPITGKYYSIK